MGFNDFLKFLLSSLIFTSFYNNPTNAQKCTVVNNTFSSGEELTYLISYNWFFVWTEVGQVKLSIENSEYNGIPSYKITGNGKTFESWDWFFKVRDTYQCQLDTQTMKPLYFRRDIQEGSYLQYEAYDFNLKKNIAISSRKVNNNPEKSDTISINECVFDVLSAFTYAHNIDFEKNKPGEAIQISVILDEEIYNIYFRYLGIEHLKIKHFGEFECIKFTLLLIEGALFKEGENMAIWVTNDKNHLPVYIETPIIIGSIKAIVTNIKGNKYPLSSLKSK
jgi:hypothetical protein